MGKLIKNCIKKIATKLAVLRLSITTTTFVFLSKKCVFAAIGNFKLFSGTQNMASDLTAWALIIIPAIGVLMFMYCNARKAIADQSDQKKWTDRRNIAVGCCIAAELADGLFAWILSYYQ